MKKKFGDEIYIYWLDCTEKPGWQEFEGIQRESEPDCFTRGWFIKEDKEFVYICHTKGKSIEEDMLGVLLIPKKSIVKIK